MMERIIDHVGLQVADLARSRAFYGQALAAMGITLAKEYAGMAIGYGRGPKPEFWIAQADASTDRPASGPIHVALTARTRDEVDAFYQAALAAGGRDNGAPGLRPEYHPGYYGAFVFDPDGHNVEAVHHTFRGG